jgi:hypothetical protein
MKKKSMLPSPNVTHKTKSDHKSLAGWVDEGKPTIPERFYYYPTSSGNMSSPSIPQSFG